MKKIILAFILGMPFWGSSQTFQNVNKTNGTSPSNNISTIDSIVFPTGGGQMQINLNNAAPVIHQLQDIVNVNFSIGGVYPAGTVFCNGTPTVIVDVTNPTTGEIWMDRNLGATQAATSSTDANSYGDLYQWGRRSDGHQCRTSATTATLSSVDQPANGNFILAPNSPFDWRSPQNDNLWQVANGVNNPCPSGYRLPTNAELGTERLSWNQNNGAGAFASPLKLTMAGYRNNSDGSLSSVGSGGYYWGSTVTGANCYSLGFGSNGANMGAYARARGGAVRCLKDVSSPQGSINTIDCGSATNNGTLTAGTAASGVSSLVPYTGGNGGTHNGQTVASTGVTGLTATLAAGTFANGAGSLTYTIIGTPSASGTASFTLSIGGQSCTLSINVLTASTPAYPPNSVFCANGPTSVVDVTNPTTGRIWMDRNLGATQAAMSSTDANSYGDLYQWGRRSDGHQCRTSATTTTLSSTDQPASGSFILAPNSPYDWRSPQNDNLWQGVNGINNPCPSAYRLPTEAELNAERLSWGVFNANAQGAFASALKLPVAGLRDYINGSLDVVGSAGLYWSSTVDGVDSQCLDFNSSNAEVIAGSRAQGFSVRCLKDVSSPQGSINTIDCGSATNNGTLTAGTTASGVSSLVPYTGGNAGTHNGQTVNSTGVSGLTATLAAGTFANGAGSLTYTISGTPSASGTASFALNIGGQSCTLTRTVGLPAGSITSLNCGSATNNGTLTSGTAASGVSSLVPYTSGNGGTHNGQTVTSTGVTGLTATLAAGTFANGTGSLTYTITGTASASGTASFALSIGGQTCTLTRTVNLQVGSITTLNCASTTNNGTLTAGTAASGVSSVVPYTGGNGGIHNGQTVTSTGVTGLTATLVAGTFTNGTGSLTYTISGTPSASGTASFALNIGGQSCTLARTVGLPAGSITSLNCASATNNGTLTSGTAASGVSSLVPYTGGNGVAYNGQTVTSTGVTGLTATLAAGTFTNGTGSLTYTITGTPSASSTASFVLSIGGQSCTLSINVLTASSPAYPPNSVFCANGPTAIVDVTNPATGKIWMDRNLGATQAATSSTDANSYGDLYQWGRRSDGHQCRTSATTTTLSSTDQPANASFIVAPNTP